jgi:hypothetical protein
LGMLREIKSAKSDREKRDAYFCVDGDVDTIEGVEDFEELLEGSETKRDFCYEQQTVNPGGAFVFSISGKHFENASFNQTVFEGVTISKCVFKNCCFNGTVFRGCSFYECTFQESSFNHAVFDNTRANPDDFADAIPTKDGKDYSNIGEHLFRMLYMSNNSRSEFGFADKAYYLMRCWQMRHTRKRLRTSKDKRLRWMLLKDRFSHLFWGFGVRFWALLRGVLCVLLLTAIINYGAIQRGVLELNSEDAASFADSVYFTIVTLTTLGYGDISPINDFGRLLVCFEVLLGIVMFGLFVAAVSSRLIRR